MQEVRLEGLEQLGKMAEKYHRAPERFQAIRAQAMDDAARQAKQIVDRHVGGTGKVRSWQGQYIGSRGGYAAVRPKAKTWTMINGRGKRYAVGAVTNAIVSGHAFPSPSGRDRHYRPRIKSGAMRVAANPFYDRALPEVRILAEETAKQVARDLMEELK